MPCMRELRVANLLALLARLQGVSRCAVRSDWVSIGSAVAVPCSITIDRGLNPGEKVPRKKVGSKPEKEGRKNARKKTPTMKYFPNIVIIQISKSDLVSTTNATRSMRGFLEK